MAEEAKVTFYQGLSSEFGSYEKDSNGIYFLTDTHEIYKGNVKYAGGDTIYATQGSVGMVKPSYDDFDVAADGTLTLYKEVKIKSFSTSLGVQDRTIGVTSIPLSWETSGTPAKITVNGVEVDATATSYTLTTTTPITSDYALTLTVTDARGHSDTANLVIDFADTIRYGALTEDEFSDSFNLSKLTGSVLAQETGCSFTVVTNANQYVYIAIPQSYSDPHLFVSGFEGGFDRTQSYEEDGTTYYIYKSSNSNLGKLYVEVR